MTSTFAWLDNSEEQRRQILDVLELFREKTTIDELGLGTVRDAFADILFPGTSAPMTRARYFLFVPWMRIPTQIDTDSACKSAPVPIEIGTCSDANRHTLFRVS